MIRRTLLAPVALLLLSACQSYVAAPLRLEAYPAAVTARAVPSPPAGGTWAGADLLAVALANNAQIAEAAAKARTAEAAVRVAKVPPVATLTLTAEYSNEASHWLYGAGSDIPLDYGARKSGRIGQAELAALQARYDLAEAVWAVRTALERARAERLGADAELVLARQAVELRRERADRLDHRVAAGEDGRGLAIVAHAELGTAQRRLADAMGRRGQADAALAKALGVSPTAVAGLPLADMSSPPAGSDWAGQRDAAALSRKDVLRAVVDYDLAEGALRTEIARQYPEVHIGPGYTYDHGVRKIPFNLSLVLPPADLNRAAIAQAEAKRAEAGRSLEAIQANVLSAVDQAAAGLAAAHAAVRLSRDDDLPNAERARRGADAAVRAGEGDRVDDLAARAALAEAQLNLLDARRAERTAAIDLEDALRMPFDPHELAVLQDHFKRLGGGR
jgi:outer membrane protein TolC